MARCLSDICLTHLLRRRPAERAGGHRECSCRQAPQEGTAGGLPWSAVRSGALTAMCCFSGAYLLSVPESVEPQPHNGTFWKALPGGKVVFWPMFTVAFLATVVASQSLISAVFQIAYQAIAQGFFPRFHVYHTSRKHKGQVCSGSAAMRICASNQLATQAKLCRWRQAAAC